MYALKIVKIIKFKKAMLLSLVLLAIMTIGAVSASDGNSTSADVMAYDESNHIESIVMSDEAIGDHSVDETVMFNVSVPDKIQVLTPFEVTFRGPEGLDGEIETYYVAYDEEGELSDFDYFEDVENGTLISQFTFLSTGNYKVNYKFQNENTSFSSSFNVNVLGPFNISVPNSVYEGNKATITFTGPKDLNGKIILKLDEDEEIVVAIKNGKGSTTFKIPYLDFITYYFSSSDGKTSFSGEFGVNVVLKPKIKAGNFKTYYSSKKKYQVRVLDGDGKPVGANKKVTFYLHAKKTLTKTVKTDKNGYAKVNFNIKSGEYYVDIKYGPTTVKLKEYTVLSVIKVKYDKRSNRMKNMHKSNKITWSVYLKKIDGKSVKNKKVTFTVYRELDSGKLSKLKSFTVKTNKKGIAKITFKKPPVKISARDMAMGFGYGVLVKYEKDENMLLYTQYAKNPYKYYFGPIWMSEV